MWPKPIRNNRDHAQALKQIDRLLESDLKPKSEEVDQLAVLTMLVDAFENAHDEHRIDDSADPVEAIQFHLERLGKTPKDLEEVLGCSRTRVWEVLNRRRPLTLPMIRALHRELGIPAERLIAEYDTHAA